MKQSKNLIQFHRYHLIENDEIIICTNAIYNIQKSNIDNYLKNIEDFFDDEYKQDDHRV